MSAISRAEKVARKLAGGDVGYDQVGRWKALRPSAKRGDGVSGVAEPGSTDCSASIGIIWFLAGVIDRVTGTWYTGNLVSRMVSTGMFKRISVRGWSLAKIIASAQNGDALRGLGHVVHCLGGGLCVSFESNEGGRSAGGRLGDQTGSEGRIRRIYARSRGWSDILRLKTENDFGGEVIAARHKGRPASAVLERLGRVSSNGRIRWSWLVDVWERWDKGMTLVLSDVARLRVPATGHAFVVLGSTPAKMARRLKAALPAIMGNAGSLVVLSGGVKRQGKTESRWMRDWLVEAGVPAARLLLEEESASTIGNARGSVAAMARAKITSYTLVSDASHLRRASIHFAAARMDQRRRGMQSTAPIAFDDYSPDGKPVSTARPVSAESRRLIAAEVATLLRVSSQYKSAL